jgi:nucleoid-associated protein YgaU
VQLSIYSRYYGSGTVEVEGAVSLAQRLTGPPPELAGSLRHTVTGRETPDQLARTYYGREDLWWRIADANPGAFPLDWQPGDVLVIPPLRVATRTPRG